jgi:ATP-dependent DNA helicase Q4
MQERTAIEQAFGAGRIRVVVATVAFGMGINLHAVKGIVHASLPRSVEEYVQQVGRAGRDGSEGHCFAFLDDGDFVTLRSLAYSGITESVSVHSLLQTVFAEVPASQPEQGMEGEADADPDATHKRFGVLDTKKLAAGLDMQEETMESILSFLEVCRCFLRATSFLFARYVV